MGAIVVFAPGVSGICVVASVEGLAVELFGGRPGTSRSPVGSGKTFVVSPEGLGCSAISVFSALGDATWAGGGSKASGDSCVVSEGLRFPEAPGSPAALLLGFSGTASGEDVSAVVWKAIPLDGGSGDSSGLGCDAGFCVSGDSTVWPSCGSVSSGVVVGAAPF